VSSESRYVKTAGVAKIVEIEKIPETIARFIEARLTSEPEVRPSQVLHF
jgi:hypothetical protein